MLRRASLTFGLTGVLALWLVLALAILTVEGAVHSVHHVGEADEAASCTVAGVASQIAGAPVEPATAQEQLLAFRDPAPEDEVSSPRVCPLRPDHERAPPSAR